MIYKNVFELVMQAMIANMKVVYDYQIGNKKRSGSAEIKAHDATLVTQCDLEGDEAANEFLFQLPLDYDIQPEDGRGRITPGAKYRAWNDSLDGTRPATNGLVTSTVIMAIYEYVSQQLIWGAVGEPISGRIWVSSLPGQETKGTWLMVRSHADPRWPWTNYATLSEPRAVNVNNDPLDSQATVLMDLGKGFSRKDPSGQTRKILTDDQIDSMFSGIRQKTGAYVLIYQSNGCQQAAVANGGEKMVASITTAMGGEWDAAGVILVLQAGGAARAFRMTNGTLTEGQPLNPYSYDILICGNNLQTVDKLCEVLFKVVDQTS